MNSAQINITLLKEKSAKRQHGSGEANKHKQTQNHDKPQERGQLKLNIKAGNSNMMKSGKMQKLQDKKLIKRYMSLGVYRGRRKHEEQKRGAASTINVKGIMVVL